MPHGLQPLTAKLCAEKVVFLLEEQIYRIQPALPYGRKTYVDVISIQYLHVRMKML